MVCDTAPTVFAGLSLCHRSFRGGLRASQNRLRSLRGGKDTRTSGPVHLLRRSHGGARGHELPG